MDSYVDDGSLEDVVVEPMIEFHEISMFSLFDPLQHNLPSAFVTSEGDWFQITESFGASEAMQSAHTTMRSDEDAVAVFCMVAVNDVAME